MNTENNMKKYKVVQRGYKGKINLDCNSLKKALRCVVWSIQRTGGDRQWLTSGKCHFHSHLIGQWKPSAHANVNDVEKNKTLRRRAANNCKQLYGLPQSKCCQKGYAEPLEGQNWDFFPLPQCLAEPGYSRVFKNERMVPTFKGGK